jgi:hypothetical protein
VYGKWLGAVFGVIAVILFAIGLIASAYAPFFAVAIALLIGMVIVFGIATRRTAQVGSEHAATAEEQRQAGQPQRASAAPAGGEGQAAEAHRAARTSGKV